MKIFWAALSGFVKKFTCELKLSSSDGFASSLRVSHVHDMSHSVGKFDLFRKEKFPIARSILVHFPTTNTNDKS